LDVNGILVGAPDEAEIAATVVEISTNPLINMSGKTDLGEAVAILSVADLLISNDMGLAHVAPSVGTDTITIFGPTNPETTRSFAQNAEIIRKAVECSPCMLRDCPIDHRCMTQISVEEVFDAAKNKLSPPIFDDIYDDIEDEVLPVIG